MNYVTIKISESHSTTADKMGKTLQRVYCKLFTNNKYLFLKITCTWTSCELSYLR